MIQTIAYPWVRGVMSGVVAASYSLNMRPVPRLLRNGQLIYIVPAGVEQLARSMAYLGLFPQPPQPLP